MINHKNISIDWFINSPIVIPSRWSGYDVERRDHLRYVMKHIKLTGDVLEFGVYRGTTINQISEFLPDKKIWGFDSFEGLPEDWLLTNDKTNIKFPKGTFNVKQETLNVSQNVVLVKGWFKDSIPKWKEKNSNVIISLMHLDCDLYDSTKNVLTNLNDQILPDTIIIFDELYNWNNPKNYELWEKGEYQALREWVSEFNREFEVISRNNYMQCAIKVIR